MFTKLTFFSIIGRVASTAVYISQLVNKVLHDKTNIHRLHGEDEINYRVNVQYRLGYEDLLPNDRHLLKDKEEVMIKKTLKYKKEWLQTIEAARSCKMPTSKSPYNYSRHVLRRFLQTGKEQTSRNGSV